MIRKIGDGMDDYEIVKQICIEALYSRELSETVSGERDACASAIRKITREEVEKRKGKFLSSEDRSSD